MTLWPYSNDRPYASTIVSVLTVVPFVPSENGELMNNETKAKILNYQKQITKQYEAISREGDPGDYRHKAINHLTKTIIALEEQSKEQTSWANSIQPNST